MEGTVKMGGVTAETVVAVATPAVMAQTEKQQWAKAATGITPAATVSSRGHERR